RDLASEAGLLILSERARERARAKDLLWCGPERGDQRGEDRAARAREGFCPATQVLPLEVEPNHRQRHRYPQPQAPLEHVGLGRVELDAQVRQPSLELLLEPPEMGVEQIP